MTDHTHAAVGSFLGALIFQRLGCPVIGLLVGGFAALVPDVDMPISAIGRMVPWLSNRIHGIFGHRTYIHNVLTCMGLSIILSLLFAAICSIFVNVSRETFWILLACVYACMLSHLLLDMLTHSGVHLFYPHGPHISGPFTSQDHSDRFLEMVITALFIVGALGICVIFYI
jgi:inner membrane protein